MQLSLKSRIVGVSIAVFGIAIALLVAFQMIEARDQFTAVLGSQQKALVVNGAAGVDEQFALARKALTLAVRSIPAEALRDADAGARFLAGQPALSAIVDDVVLVGTNGKVVADMPALEGRRGLDLSDREHIARTLSTRRSVISQPYLGRVTNAPSIAITVPVVSGTGQILGVISGSVSLLKPNFLGRLAKETVGRTGYYFLVARGDKPMVIIHPDMDRMMKPVTAAIPEAERALRGWEGAEEGVDAKGVKLLMAYQPLREVEWVLAAGLPSREAYEPLNSLIVRFAASGIALAVPLAALLWFFIGRILRSLAAARRLVQGLERDSAKIDEIEALPQDEVGRLVRDVARALRTQLKKGEQLASRAHEDPLTGLPNRYLFQDRMMHALVRARRNRERVALLAVDVDRFKGLNEMRGSDTGDAALKEVARRLRAAVRASDTVARLEGDNFVVILERLPLAGPGEDGTAGVKAASSVAEKVVACLRLPFVPAGVPVSITACAGLALQREGDTTDALLARAETALGEVKGAGRSVWRIAAGD